MNQALGAKQQSGQRSKYQQSDICGCQQFSKILLSDQVFVAVLIRLFVVV